MREAACVAAVRRCSDVFSLLSSEAARVQCPVAHAVHNAARGMQHPWAAWVDAQQRGGAVRFSKHQPSLQVDLEERVGSTAGT